MRLRTEGVLGIAALGLAGLACLAPATPGGWRVGADEAALVRGELCKICEIQVAQTCTARNGIPCTLLSACSRCTLGFQNAYCVFNLFGGDCTPRPPIGCGNEELGVCHVGTGVCTFTGVFLTGCGTVADCI